MTPLERLLLSKIFQFERVNDGWYFFAEENPTVMITVERKELEEDLRLRLMPTAKHTSASVRRLPLRMPAPRNLICARL
jgi:hypothetical protein